MANSKENDRFKKLLDDWKPSGSQPNPGERKPSVGASSKQGFMPEPMLIRNTRPAAPPRNAPEPAQATPVATPARSAEPTSGNAHSTEPELAQHGAILLINQSTLAVYERNVPDKNYHLVLLLTPGGGAKLQGVVLQAHQLEEIGKLPPQYLQQLETSMVWDRDLIVFHCYRYEDAQRVPQQFGQVEIATTNATAHAPAQPAIQSSAPVSAGPVAAELMPNRPTRRGQRVHIKFGANAWNSIYWGNDAQGTVVAHNTHGKWSLMHLDLERFSESLVVEADIDDQLITEIESALMAEQA